MPMGRKNKGRHKNLKRGPKAKAKHLAEKARKSPARPIDSSREVGSMLVVPAAMAALFRDPRQVTSEELYAVAQAVYGEGE
jgi:hypothetical protein